MLPSLFPFPSFLELGLFSDPFKNRLWFKCRFKVKAHKGHLFCQYDFPHFPKVLLLDPTVAFVYVDTQIIRQRRTYSIDTKDFSLFFPQKYTFMLILWVEGKKIEIYHEVSKYPESNMSHIQPMGRVLFKSLGTLWGEFCFLSVSSPSRIKLARVKSCT